VQINLQKCTVRALGMKFASLHIRHKHSNKLGGEPWVSSLKNVVQDVVTADPGFQTNNNLCKESHDDTTLEALKTTELMRNGSLISYTPCTSVWH